MCGLFVKQIACCFWTPRKKLNFKQLKVKQDLSISKQEVFEQLETSAEEGDLTATFKLAQCYENGEGTEINLEEAFNNYQICAVQGNKDAQLILGKFYDKGIGTEIDKNESVKFYRLASEKVQENRIENINQLPNQGNFVDIEKNNEIDDEEIDNNITQYWEREISSDIVLGKIDALINDLEMKILDKESKYYQLIKKEKNNSEYQNYIGMDYLNGNFVKQNYEEAIKWFHLAAEQENKFSQHNIGWCHYNGRGVKKNNEEALKWFHLSAEQGGKVSQYMIGLCH